MIKCDAIQLRIWEEHDLQVLSQIRNDVVLQGQLLTRVRGNNMEQVRDWLIKVGSQADKLFFIIAGRETNEALGFIQISDLALVDQRAELGICLINEARGRGVGGKSIDLVCSYLQKTWGIRKICLKVRHDNKAAIRCYRKIGFQSCGQLRQHMFIEGGWHDVMLMEMFLDRQS